MCGEMPTGYRSSRRLKTSMPLHVTTFRALLKAHFSRRNMEPHPDALTAAASRNPTPGPTPQYTRSRRRGEGRRYGFACTNCKSRKVKCSGDQPVCSACQRSGAICTWQTPSAEKQLQQATARIHQLERALREANARETRLAASEGIAPSPVSTCTQPSPTASSNLTSGPSLWFQVGLGDDGAVTYHGPTSRFHAGPLDDNSVEEAQQQCSRHPTPLSVKQARKAAYVGALGTQYSLLDNVWAPLINSRPSFEKLGLDGDMCMTLLDIYWTWLQPLHNCVYRQSEPLKRRFACSNIRCLTFEQAS